MRKTKLLPLIFILTILFSLTSCISNEAIMENDVSDSASLQSNGQPLSEDFPIENENDNSTTLPNSNSRFEVHYLDVGQADAALVFCDNETMLIDGGNPGDSSLIAACLKKHNIETLDYIVCSHAHDDHVGGLPGALSVAKAKRVFAPKTESNIDSYQSFKSKVSAQGLTVENPSPGDTFKFGESTVLFLGPVHENVGDLNDTSIVLKITYGETSFLFTGDAERDEEQSILTQNYDLSATVLKVGHHGSGDSTTYPFLREIMPEYAIISVGENNYGHPTEETLSRLRDADVKVFRTDMQGDIIVSSNGKTVSVKTIRNQYIDTNPTVKKDNPPVSDSQNNSQTYIGNKNTKKFHLPSCYSLPYEKNRVYFSSRQEAINSGYSSCGNCHP